MRFSFSEHCTVEYNGDAVVLYPKVALCSVDGIPVSEPTRLPQGILETISSGTLKIERFLLNREPQTSPAVYSSEFAVFT